MGKRKEKRPFEPSITGTVLEYSAGHLKPTLLFTFCGFEQGCFCNKKRIPWHSLALQTWNITHIAYLGNFLAVHFFSLSYKNHHYCSSTVCPHLALN